MKREELYGMTADEIWNAVIEKHGLRKANILVAEASFKMIKKQLSIDVVLSIHMEACIRVLSGQKGAKDILIEKHLL